MTVYKLTQEQKDLLSGVYYDNESFFNPIQDANDNWVISEEEVSQCCIDNDFDWVKRLPQIEFVAKEIDFKI